MILYPSKARRNSNQLRTILRVMRSNKKILWFALGLLVIIGVVRYFYDSSKSHSPSKKSKFIAGIDGADTYGRDMPLIFIGGVPRSGQHMLFMGEGRIFDGKFQQILDEKNIFVINIF